MQSVIERQAVESYSDDRAIRYFDVFPGLIGQITISLVACNAVSGWHKHLDQIDQFFVAKGNLLVTTISPDGVVERLDLTSDNPTIITVPPNYWHGWRSFEDEVMLCYYLSEKHNESDEIRVSREGANINTERFYANVSRSCQPLEECDHCIGPHVQHEGAL